MSRIINKVVSIIIFVLSIIVCSISILNFSNFVVNAEYVEMDQELRAAWVSPWGGDSDLCTYKNENDFKEKMNYILDTLEMYNMNTIIYHVRTHNNAMYKSSLNPVASYWKDVNFNTFDPLEWLIGECHKRGIEFHAWLNPYRVKSSSSTSLESIALTYDNFKANPASDVNNMLMGDGTVILNPGLQNVRDFIVSTVMELVNGYDVDAIHFDDYFYCNMGANGKTSGSTTIISEPDQVTYEAYIDANPNCGLSKTSATNKADWRRTQVDLFIEQLHNALSNYNSENNKHVELGIAPTGIYKNGDGKVTYNANGDAVSNGSKTSGQTHYSSYLFCDTVNWINKEWIDYIMPQSYWGFGHPVAGYNEVMGWWNQVVKNKKVNLYSGIGLYMADSSGNTYTWQTDEYELKKQLEYIAGASFIDGASIYNFNNLRKLRDGKTTQVATEISNALVSDCWQRVVCQPEIKSFEKINLGKVQKFKIDGNTLSFDKLDGAKFYVVYRSTNEVTFSANEVVDVFGSNSDRVTWTDKDSGTYNYGIKALSYSNTLGAGQKETVKNFNVKFVDYDDREISCQTVEEGSSATAPENPTRVGYTFTGWSTSFDNVTSDLIVKAEYLKNARMVNITINGEVQAFVFGEEVTLKSENDNFISWNIDGHVVSFDKEFKFIAYKDLVINESVTGQRSDKILYFVQKYEVEGVKLINVQVYNIDYNRIDVSCIYTLDGSDPLLNNCFVCNSCELENSNTFTCDANATLRFMVKVNTNGVFVYDYSDLISYNK